MITGINKIKVSVNDQQAALEFWRDKLGFEVVTDATYGPNRWIEVASPNRAVVFVLAAPLEGDPGNSFIPDGQPTVGAMLSTDDLDASYREMTSAGVEFLAAPEKFAWGWFSMFTDGQGNRIALVPTGQ